MRFESSATDNVEQGAFRYAVSPGYLETMAVPLRRGRLLNEHDTANAPPVVLISESLAGANSGIKSRSASAYGWAQTMVHGATIVEWLAM